MTSEEDPWLSNPRESPWYPGRELACFRGTLADVDFRQTPHGMIDAYFTLQTEVADVACFAWRHAWSRVDRLQMADGVHVTILGNLQQNTQTVILTAMSFGHNAECPDPEADTAQGRRLQQLDNEGPVHHGTHAS